MAEIELRVGPPVGKPSPGSREGKNGGRGNPPWNRRNGAIDGGVVRPDLSFLPRTLLHQQHGVDRLSGSAVSTSARSTHPPCQATSDPGDACPFLSHYGCRLPPRIRPWMCIQYVCPTQRVVLKRKGRSATTALLSKIERIEKKRFMMEAEVIRRIKRKIRTSPSSSSACSG